MAPHQPLTPLLIPITIILFATLLLITTNSQFRYYHPHPTRPSSPTTLINTPGSSFGYITDVPYDPMDSFTNYEWEPEEEDDNDYNPDNDNNRNNPNPHIPEYTYRHSNLHPLLPTTSRGISHTSSRPMITRIPIKPYDSAGVYMDGNEDSFDGVSNNRWNEPARDLIPLHVSLNGPNRPNDASLFPPSNPNGERSNIPFSRRLGFDYAATYLDTPTMVRSNRERYIDVDMGNGLLNRRTLFHPPHYPGLQ